MRKILFVIFMLLNLLLDAQNFQTNSCNLVSSYPFFEVEQFSGNLHYEPIRTYGINFIYTHSYYLKSKHAISWSFSPGLNILTETMSIPAEQYNLEWDFWDRRSKYIPNFSFSISYSYIFITKDNFSYYFCLSPGIVSALGFNNSSTFAMKGVEELILINENFDHIPSPILNFEIGTKKEIKNGNFLNISICSQIGFKDKYNLRHEYFPTQPEFYSLSQFNTNLSYIGFKIGYEFKALV